MAISFECERCGKKLKAPDGAVGKTSKCPGCGAPVTCPEPVYDAELLDVVPGGAGSPVDIDAGRPYEMEPEPVAAPSGEPRRPCPMCGEMIVATAVKCRFCGEVFDPALRKAQKKRAGRRGPGAEELSAGDILVGLLCSGIGCIAGIVWMIQGKPKGLKMVLLSIIADVVKSVVVTFIRSQPPGGGLGP